MNCSVGRKIVTKRVDVNDPEGDSDIWDVTTLYKNPENTAAERLAVYNAVRGIPVAQEFYEVKDSGEESDVFFDLIDIDTVPIGESFDVVVKIVNKSSEERTILAVLNAGAVLYTGAAAGDIKKSQGTFKVFPVVFFWHFASVFLPRLKQGEKTLYKCESPLKNIWTN